LNFANLAAHTVSVYRTKKDAPLKLSDFMLDFSNSRSEQDLKDMRKRQTSDLLFWGRTLRSQQQQQKKDNKS